MMIVITILVLVKEHIYHELSFIFEEFGFEQ